MRGGGHHGGHGGRVFRSGFRGYRRWGNFGPSYVDYYGYSPCFSCYGQPAPLFYQCLQYYGCALPSGMGQEAENVMSYAGHQSSQARRAAVLYAAAGLGQTPAKSASGSKTSPADAGPDNTASDWAAGLTAFGPVIGSIIGAATGQPTATTPAATTPAVDPATATAAPVSAGPSWYWPVLIGVGVAVFGGIAYMSYNVKAPVKSNRGKRRSRSRSRSRRVSRNSRRRSPMVDTKVYSVVDRLTGFAQRNLTKEQAQRSLDSHREQCARYGWRENTKVFYRDGSDVTREFE